MKKKSIFVYFVMIPILMVFGTLAQRVSDRSFIEENGVSIVEYLLLSREDFPLGGVEGILLEQYDVEKEDILSWEQSWFEAGFNLAIRIKPPFKSGAGIFEEMPPIFKFWGGRTGVWTSAYDHTLPRTLAEEKKLSQRAARTPYRSLSWFYATYVPTFMKRIIELVVIAFFVAWYMTHMFWSNK